jgi:serine/threonine protein kinase
MSDCPSREALKRFLGEECSEEDRASLAAHVRRCPSCLETVSDLGGGPAERASEEAFIRGLEQASPPPALPSVPGYEVLEELGRGGMGVVYKARQVKLDRLVALKMMFGGPADEPERARFRGEAEAAARLQHPGIVQIFEVGDAPAGPFFSLELVPGGSLAQKLAATPQEPRWSAALVRQLALAVQAAHAAGVLHRDLKPGNVLLAVSAVGNALRRLSRL